MSGNQDEEQLASKVAAGLSINIPGQKTAAAEVPKKAKRPCQYL